MPQVKPQIERIPRPPVFATPAEERRHRKEKLAGSFRLFSRCGFDEGVTGHITARDPERLDHFWVNPFAIHSRIHKARPDVVAAAHAHSLHGKAWSSLGRLLDPITQDACAFYEDHAVFDDYTGVVNETDEGDRIARALGNKKAGILRNHGLLTVGHTVDEAVWWFITMDRSCQAQLLAEAAGPPHSIPHQTAKLTYTQVGSHLAGWFQFQPLWHRITCEQPDLFE